MLQTQRNITSSSICPQAFAISSSLSVVLKCSISTSDVPPNSLTKLDSTAPCWDLSTTDGDRRCLGDDNGVLWTDGDWNFPAVSNLCELATGPFGESVVRPGLVLMRGDLAWPTTGDLAWSAGAVGGAAGGLSGVLRVRRPGVFWAVMFCNVTHPHACWHLQTTMVKL